MRIYNQRRCRGLAASIAEPIPLLDLIPLSALLTGLRSSYVSRHGLETSARAAAQAHRQQFPPLKALDPKLTPRAQSPTL